MHRGIVVSAESNITGAVKYLLEDVFEATWEVCSGVSDVNDDVLQSSSLVVFNLLEEDDSLNKLMIALQFIPSHKLIVFGYVNEHIFIEELHKIGVQYYLPFNSSRSEVSQVINKVLTIKTR